MNFLVHISRSICMGNGLQTFSDWNPLFMDKLRPRVSRQLVVKLEVGFSSYKMLKLIFKKKVSLVL